MDNPITQELIKPDSDIERKNEKNSVDQNTALIVSKYMNDDQTAKLIWTCKKYRELFDLRFFNYDDLTQQTMGYYNIDNLEKVYIYNNPKIALQLYNQNRIKKLINYVPEAFENEGFNLPSNTVNIPAFRFLYHSFNEYPYEGTFVVPDQIRFIDDSAFEQSNGLTQIIFNDIVESIGDSAFEDCDLCSITIPSSITHIGSYCFSECSSLTSAEILAPIDVLPDKIFDNCPFLESVVLPTTITRLGNYCFRDCDLTSITLPPNLIEIGDDCFLRGDKLTTIQLPTTLRRIGEGAFGDCNTLVDITIPDGVIDIPDYCFEGCTGLTHIQLPSHLTHIGECAFEDCYRLQIPDFPPSLINIAENAFENVY